MDPSVTIACVAVNPDKFKLVPDATPIFGVVSDGEVCNTTFPVPVGVTQEVVFPELVIIPVKFALVVTLVAVPVRVAVIVPALKFPDPSRRTTELLVLLLKFDGW